MARARWLAQVALVFFLLASATAQTVSRAYIGEDKRVHLVFSNGATKVMTPEPKQVDCAQVAISPDHRTVAWTMLIDNCCASYPVDIAIIVYRNGHKTVITPGQMVHEWRFEPGGNRIAVLSGPTHGWAGQAQLYSISGKLLASWHGNGEPPSWAESWEDEFEH